MELSGKVAMLIQGSLNASFPHVSMPYHVPQL